MSSITFDDWGGGGGALSLSLSSYIAAWLVEAQNNSFSVCVTAFKQSTSLIFAALLIIRDRYSNSNNCFHHYIIMLPSSCI